MNDDPSFEMVQETGPQGDDLAAQVPLQGPISPEDEPMVDPEEACLEGGLADPRENDDTSSVENKALNHLATGVQKAMACLVESMTPESSARTLLQISKTAGHLHRITLLYDTEDDYLIDNSPLAKRKARKNKRMNRETAGVKMMQDVVSVLGHLTNKRSMTDDLRAVKAAQDAGMEDVAKQLQDALCRMLIDSLDAK